MSSTPPPFEPDRTPPATRAEAAQASYAAPPIAEPHGRALSAKGPRGLGLIAFVVSLAAIVIGSVLGILGGIQSGSLTQFAAITDGTASIDPDALPAAANQIGLAAGILSVSAFLAWGVLALWGFIQGIVAAVKNRGRGWAIAAIVLAVVGGGVVFVFFGIGAAIGAAPYVQ
ncbi:hypothetical protein [Microbacterium sp. 5K110]|uniref:hypothetical protein n=1 Tax=unclassified Microbacterium TaxID=2609290 RepID=UPI0010FE3152|nr:hypothetical protein [Microbacterium sp. 5K110]TLF33612.1 hypothetical protein FE256_03100 [Microbacterium sp. 5K110]